jgi:hydrogenase expression/formation protein HypC
MRGNHVDVCTVLIGPVEPGEWVLVHAGYAITKVDAQEAAQTWEILSEAANELKQHRRGLETGTDE